jgi:hypothetical protein
MDILWDTGQCAALPVYPVVKGKFSEYFGELGCVVRLMADHDY